MWFSLPKNMFKMKMLIVTVLLTFVFLAGVSSEVGVTKDVMEAVHLLNSFSQRFYYQLAKTNDDNVFVCPASVSAVLGMLLLGARGVSRRELEDVMRLNSSGLTGQYKFHEAQMKLTGLIRKNVVANKDFDLELANGVFIRKGMPVYEKYQKDLQRYYQSGIYAADFAGDSQEAKDDLNSWVQDMTHDKVSQILEKPLPNSTPLVILNAIYFKGHWMHPFDRQNTKPGTFYNHGRAPTEAQMMNQQGQFFYVEDEPTDSQVVELPYNSEKVVMVILLPKSKTGLMRLQDNLDYSRIRSSLGSIIKQKVNVTIPKFALSETYDLREPLTGMGVKSLFEERDADLTGIANRPVIAVNNLLHKAIVDVDEEGSTAIGITSGITRHSLVSPRESVFLADHPFLVVIEDLTTNAILFMGRVNKL